MKITMVEQFNKIQDDKKKPKPDKVKGPIDLKEIRQQIQKWDGKNRKP